MIDIQSVDAQQAPTAQAKQPPAKSPTAKAPAAERSAPQGDSQLRGRIDQLEEQLSDMQVAIGTLESLGRGGGTPATGASRGGGGGGVDQARLDSLETQIRALTSQLEQLAAQVRQLSGGRRGDTGGFGGPPTSVATAPPVAPGPPPGGGFGSTTVTPEGGDPIGRILGRDEDSAPVTKLSVIPPQGAGNPRELYETAYGYLLQQDYNAAEVAFEEFLSRYPGDRLAADAQYWLGETLYVQRRYKPAGQAFLTVIEKHKASSKVPNSLLKLAQSLEQLGQKDCGIFAELESRHPNAPADVKVKARALKQRQGC